MKRLLIALALCAASPCFAGTLKIACIGPESGDYPVAIDATLDTERLSVSFITGPARADGTHATVKTGWCGPSRDRPKVGWGISEQGCAEAGTFRVVNGELTKRKLAQGQVQFGIFSPMAICFEGSLGPTCVGQNAGFKP